jgi:hypothetical protein
MKGTIRFLSSNFGALNFFVVEVMFQTSDVVAEASFWSYCNEDYAFAKKLEPGDLRNRGGTERARTNIWLR